MKKRDILIAQLKAKVKVAEVVQSFDKRFLNQEKQNGNNPPPASNPQVPSQPLPNNGS